jgi:hypothetical protein
MENKQDGAFQSFIDNLNHEARINEKETKEEHAGRLLSEVDEVLSGPAGIQSSEEATLLLAKLDIVIEASNDYAIKAAAKNYIADIVSRSTDV